MEICKVDGCERQAMAKSYCRMHYYRLYRNGTIERINGTTQGTCDVDGCDNPIYANNLCKKHYSRIQRNGDLDLRKRGRNQEFMESIRNKHLVLMKNEGATYTELADIFSISKQRVYQIYERDKDKYLAN
jgi:hypothetical protein